jgi:DNA-binding phage protein
LSRGNAKKAGFSAGNQIADHIIICHAIGDATRSHNISDIAKITGIERANIYQVLRASTYQT